MSPTSPKLICTEISWLFLRTMKSILQIEFHSGPYMKTRAQSLHRLPLPSFPCPAIPSLTSAILRLSTKHPVHTPPHDFPGFPPTPISRSYVDIFGGVGVLLSLNHTRFDWGNFSPTTPGTSQTLPEGLDPLPC
eukprot:759340-Hanusia_phi.AAC.3